MEPPQAVQQLVVLSHPSAQSFCSSIAQRWQNRAARNHQICDLRDLYREGFDPVLKAAEQPALFYPIVLVFFCDGLFWAHFCLTAALRRYRLRPRH